MRTAIYHNVRSGGAKRTIFETVKRLMDEHLIDIWTLSTADHNFCDLRPFIHCHSVSRFQPLRLFNSPLGRLNQLQRWRDLGRLEILAEQIASDIDDHNYDVVYVHPCMWTQAPLVLKFFRTPSVYHIHEPLRMAYEPPIPRPYLNGGWRKQVDMLDPFIALYRHALVNLDKTSMLRASTLLANSSFTATNVNKIYGRSAEVAYFGVDSTIFRSLPSVEKEGFVLSIGAIRPNKGFDFLVESLARINESDRPALWIIGNTEDPRERSYLAQLAEQKDVELVIETMVDQETLVRRYNQAALLVYAPIREPFGLVSLESMACGTPVVGVAEGGFQEAIVEGETGFLTPREPDAFSKMVANLLSKPNQCKQMGQAGRDHVLRNWTWEAAVKRIEISLAKAAQSTIII